MNALYAKAILCLYPSIDSMTEVIDRNVMKKALASFRDYSPVNEQAEEILSYTREKNLLIDLKLAVNSVFKCFTPEERALLLNRFGEYFKGHTVPEGMNKRTYYRRINKLISRFCAHLDRAGFTDEYFADNYLTVQFVRKIFLKVRKYENSFTVNRASEKAVSDKGDIEVSGRALAREYGAIKAELTERVKRTGER